MTIPIRTKTPDGWTITPSQPKSFRSVIEEARQRIAEGLDIDAQDAIEGQEQYKRCKTMRFNQGE